MPHGPRRAFPISSPVRTFGSPSRTMGYAACTVSSMAHLRRDRSRRRRGGAPLLISGCSGADELGRRGDRLGTCPHDPAQRHARRRRRLHHVDHDHDVAPLATATIATDLDVPWAIAFLPDGSALVTLRDKAELLHVRAGQAAHGARDGPGRAAGRRGRPAGRRGVTARSPATQHLRLLHRGRRQPRRAADLRGRGADAARGRAARHTQGRATTTAGGSPSAPTATSTSPPATPGSPSAPRTGLARRQDPADHDGRQARARQPVRRLARLDATATATSRASPGTPTGGCTPASSGRTPGTSSTSSSPGSNYGWPVVEGRAGRSRLHRPARPVADLRRLAERDRRGRRRGLDGGPAWRVAVASSR